jgi:AraC-like DNA-binding protein
MMRAESMADALGGQAMLNALSAALFTVVLRLAGESEDAPPGLLALAGHPRLAPALAAMLGDPAHPWTLPELARLCNMSRATMARHFEDRVGRSASDFLTDIRIGLAINELQNPLLLDRSGCRERWVIDRWVPSGLPSRNAWACRQRTGDERLAGRAPRNSERFRSVFARFFPGWTERSAS